MCFVRPRGYAAVGVTWWWGSRVVVVVWWQQGAVVAVVLRPGCASFFILELGGYPAVVVMHPWVRAGSGGRVARGGYASLFIARRRSSGAMTIMRWRGFAVVVVVWQWGCTEVIASQH